MGLKDTSGSPPLSYFLKHCMYFSRSDAQVVCVRAWRACVGACVRERLNKRISEPAQ